MTKFTLNSTNESALSIIDNRELELNNKTTLVNKGYFFQFFSEMSQYFYNFQRSKIFQPSIETNEIEGPIKKQNDGSQTHHLRTAELALKLGISETILTRVLQKLESFELAHGYLDKELTLNSLAKSFGTNHSYLSKIIHLTKDKSFKSYLNDLRIEFAYEDLQQNTHRRKYTIEAIAYENGFRSAESFSKKFKARYQIYPSKFLKTLEA